MKAKSEGDGDHIERKRAKDSEPLGRGHGGHQKEHASWCQLDDRGGHRHHHGKAGFGGLPHGRGDRSTSEHGKDREADREGDDRKEVGLDEGCKRVFRDHRLDLREEHLAQAFGCHRLGGSRLRQAVGSQAWSHDIDHHQAGDDRQHAGGEVVAECAGKHAA